jgi:hypothetical protein
MANDKERPESGARDEINRVKLRLPMLAAEAQAAPLEQADDMGTLELTEEDFRLTVGSKPCMWHSD